jgi:3-oxoacyl-[acyl-carrier protein] reductase
MPVALITGASRGLGREISIALAGIGYEVFINYLSSDREAEDLTRSIGAGARTIKADVGEPVQVRRMADLIRDEAGRLDVVINNAGITRDALLIRQSEDEWDAIIRTNLKGCFNIIRTMAPLMVKSGGGHIINISSRSGLRGKAGQSAYSASKAALLGLTYASAAELAEHNIRVNAVLPGYMLTGMGAKAGRAAEEAGRSSVLNRLSSSSEAAAFIASILRTEGITGQVFSLDSRI